MGGTDRSVLYNANRSVNIALVRSVTPLSLHRLMKPTERPLDNRSTPRIILKRNKIRIYIANKNEEGSLMTGNGKQTEASLDKQSKEILCLSSYLCPQMGCCHLSDYCLPITSTNIFLKLSFIKLQELNKESTINMNY